MSDKTRDTATTLDAALMGAISKALDPEKLQRTVEEQVASIVKDWVSDSLRSYGGGPREAFRARMFELMVPAIERMCLDNAKLDVLLSTLVSESVAGERAQLLGNFAKLVCTPKEDVVPASKIFEAWCDYVAEEYDCSGREVVDGEYKPIDCNCDFEESEENAWSDHKMATLTLLVDDCDEEQATATNRVLHLYRWGTLPQDEDLWFVHYPPRPEIGSIAAMSGIDVMLTRLSMGGTKVLNDIDWRGICDCVTPSTKPELEYV